MLLRKDDPWISSLPIPDIRNWRVYDADGETVGFVQSLMVHAADGSVETLFTGANDRHNMDDVEIGEGSVRLKTSFVRRDHGTGGDRSRDDEFGKFEKAFRDHFSRQFREDEHDFADLQDAYLFGRRVAMDADYSGRPFDRAEEDVRAQYVARGVQPNYTEAREAVRLGFSLAQGLEKFDASGMNREWKQMLGPGPRGEGEPDSAGAAMDTGRPTGDDKSVLDSP